jgi:hypothetical protein
VADDDKMMLEFEYEGLSFNKVSTSLVEKKLARIAKSRMADAKLVQVPPALQLSNPKHFELGYRNQVDTESNQKTNRIITEDIRPFKSDARDDNGFKKIDIRQKINDITK